MASNDPAIFQEFRDALGTRDPKTIATYLTTMRGFVAWLETQPGGAPFHLGLVTETTIRGYMDSLQHAGRAPRTRSKALSARLELVARRCPHYAGFVAGRRMRATFAAIQRA